MINKIFKIRSVRYQFPIRPGLEFKTKDKRWHVSIDFNWSNGATDHVACPWIRFAIDQSKSSLTRHRFVFRFMFSPPDPTDCLSYEFSVCRAELKSSLKILKFSKNQFP